MNVDFILMPFLIHLIAGGRVFCRLMFTRPFPQSIAATADRILQIARWKWSGCEVTLTTHERNRTMSMHPPLGEQS